MLSALLVLIVSACRPTAPVAPTMAPARVEVPPAPAVTSGRKEVALVAGPRKRLEELLVALQKGDAPAARTAMETYNSEWNGVEVYVNFRSRALYGEIETHYEADITNGLQEASPNTAALVPLAQAMIGQYDQAIKLSDTGPSLSPLFEDVASVRIARAPLRTVSPALKAGDTARASTAFKEFKSRWPSAQPLFAARSADALRDTEAALAAADKAMSASSINATEARPLVDTLLERYNYGVNLLNAAARNATVDKSTFSTEDVQGAAALAAMQKQLRASRAAWDAGNKSLSLEAARDAAGPRLDAVTNQLKASGGADAGIKTALDAYVTAAADAASDPAQVRTTNQMAIEALAIAQQALAGQFWTDPSFTRAYQAAAGTP
jgi:hypothetical protein